MQRPSGRRPQHNGKDTDGDQGQAIADVHGSQEIAFFPLKFEAANGAAFAHPRETSENRRTKYSGATASWAHLMKYCRRCRDSGCRLHENMEPASGTLLLSQVPTDTVSGTPRLSIERDLFTGLAAPFFAEFPLLPRPYK